MTGAAVLVQIRIRFGSGSGFDRFEYRLGVQD
jgi:hypothetical protein